MGEVRSAVVLQRRTQERGGKGSLRAAGTNGLSLDGWVELERGSHSCIKTCCRDNKLQKGDMECSGREWIRMVREGFTEKISEQRLEEVSQIYE